MAVRINKKTVWSPDCFRGSSSLSSGSKRQVDKLKSLPPKGERIEGSERKTGSGLERPASRLSENRVSVVGMESHLDDQNLIKEVVYELFSL